MGQAGAQSLAQLGIILLRYPPGRNQSARAVPDFEESFFLKLSIRRRNRIQIHTQIIGNLTHRRQGHPFTQFTASNQPFDLIRYLSIDWPPVGFVNSYVHSRVSPDTIHWKKLAVKTKVSADECGDSTLSA